MAEEQKLIAHRLWETDIAYREAKENADDALLIAAGIDPNGTKDWPCQDITYDDYDGSFEFKKTREGWEPSPEILAAWWALGFSRCWICYTDGTEKYYTSTALLLPFPAPVA